MNGGAWMMVGVVTIVGVSLGFLLFSMVRSIQDERSKGRSIWREFGLSLVLLTLFLTSWIAQGIGQWQTYTDEQREHGQEATIGDFISDFTTSTLENWQSEFLQLFAFVTLAALYMHKGSAESKDGSEKMEASLRRLEEKLGTLPDSAPKASANMWKLPDAPPLRKTG